VETPAHHPKPERVGTGYSLVPMLMGGVRVITVSLGPRW
jgi:hypothetical protein